MSCAAHVRAPLPVLRAAASAWRVARTQRALGMVLLIVVVALDQGTKAWAWRHVPDAVINAGSTGGIGGLNGWFSGRESGAILDLVSSGVLCGGAFLLLRRRRSSGILVSAALIIAGWGSNLLDRLGMHMVTAPGSVRGAVDFIQLGRYHVNVADLVIVAATIAYLTLVVRRHPTRSSRRAWPANRDVVPAPRRGRELLRMPAWTTTTASTDRCT